MADRFDKRLTPARPDLAATHLKGVVEASRFVEGEKFSVIAGRASLCVKPSADAAQDSELLFGESFTIYERKDGWAWGQAAADSYVGYVRDDLLGAPFTPDARIIAPMAPAFAAPDLKTPVRDMLPLNARVKRAALEGDYHQVAPGRFVHYRQLAPLDEFAADFVAVAERFLGVPYVWGGKTFAGLDCSGLIQTALQACGTDCPRDTDMQEKVLGEGVRLDSLQRGDLVFWKGHVGVMRDATQLLHANAFHMQVAAEPLSESTLRIEKACGPVTSIKRF
jgi:cell wall-associated NlpC family hydrolase